MSAPTEVDEPLKCVQAHDGTCNGPVELHLSTGGTGYSYPRCRGHYGRLLDRQREIWERYPDSDTPPSWFDPTYAGESWNDD